MTVGARDGAPRQRRDARRNRELLLEAAHEVFTEQGLDAPLDVIARRAGVGNATLYRHFPTRAALVDAVFRDSLTGTMDAGEQARRAPDAWAGLTAYLEVVFRTLAADRGSNDLMTTHLRGVESLEAVHEHNRRTVDALLSRLRDEGTVRADVTTEDVLFGLAALGRAVPALTAATATPGGRATLDARATPGGMASPGARATLDARATPGGMASPGARATLDARATPGATASPGARATPDATVSPDARATPVTTATPDATASPGARASPDTTATPDTTASPDADATAPDAWRRPLALFLAGLRTAPAAGPLPAPALTAAELGEVLRELGPHRTRAGDREPGA
jgi:AcrR family transcriptional regulator